MKPLKKEIFCTTYSEKLISLTPYCTPRLYSPNTQKPNPVPWVQSSIPRISFSYLTCHIPTTLSGSSGWFSKSSQGFPIEHWLMALSLDFIQQLWRKTRVVSSRCRSTCRGFFCLCYAQHTDFNRTGWTKRIDHRLWNCLQHEALWASCLFFLLLTFLT